MGGSAKPHGRLWTWLDERVGLAELEKLVKKKEVPVHRHTVWYYLGGMTLFLFMIQVAAVKKQADAGLTIAQKAYARGVRALEELRFRRTGLVVSLVIIVVLIAGLVLKLRQLERRTGSPVKG